MDHIEQATAAPGEGRHLPPLERIEVVSLRDGDRIVATFSERLGPETAARAKDELGRIFPGHQVVVVDGSVSVKVVRPEDGE